MRSFEKPHRAGTHKKFLPNNRHPDGRKAKRAAQQHARRVPSAPALAHTYVSLSKEIAGASFTCPRDPLLAPFGRPLGHFAQRYKEVADFRLIERPEDPRFTCPDEASARRGHVPYGVRDALVLVTAPVKAILPDPADLVVHRAIFSARTGLYTQQGVIPNRR